MVIFKFIINFFQRLIRHLYWIYQLQNASHGVNFTFGFPVIVEGKGSLSFGNHCHLKKNVGLKKAKDSKIIIGNNGFLDNESHILTSEKCCLLVGDNFKLGERSKLYVQNNWEFGNDVKIETYCSIFSREQGFYGCLKIKDGTHIGDNTIIDVTDNINIGYEVAIGPNCVLYTHDHDYSQKEKASWKGGTYTKPITIGDGAWIGSGVTILPGINIGSRCVVAAGSVITKNLEANSVYGGVPAKFIKSI